jgi:hypothetical protein
MQERFFVRTVRVQDGQTVIEHTVADNRPQAVKQAERIGRIDSAYHSRVRNFLEGREDSYKELKVYSTDAVRAQMAVIYPID